MPANELHLQSGRLSDQKSVLDQTWSLKGDIVTIQRRFTLRLGAVLATGYWLLAGQANAAVVFPQPTAELGQIRMGQAAEHKFTFTNQGPAAITPVEVKTSCGCLHPVVEQRAFEAGESGSLTLKINTLSATPGPHVWSVKLHYKEQNVLYEIALAVKAYVLQEISVTPPAMIVYASGAVQHQITLTDLRPQSFQVLGVESSSDHMQTKVASEFVNKSGHRVRQISLQINAAFPIGRKDEQVIIHTSDPTYKEIRVPVTVVKREVTRFTALPGKVDVVASAAQPAPSRIITVRDSQNQPVIIERIDADDPAITCQWAQGPNAVGTVKVMVDRSKMETDSLQSKIQVQFRSGDSLSIPVTCTVR